MIHSMHGEPLARCQQDHYTDATLQAQDGGMHPRSQTVLACLLQQAWEKAKLGSTQALLPSLEAC